MSDSTNGIYLDTDAADELINRLISLKNRWIEERITPPDGDSTESKGGAIDSLNFLVQSYMTFDDDITDLLEKTIAFLTLAKDGMIYYDQQAACYASNGIGG
jgi:hypothetical protein